MPINRPETPLGQHIRVLRNHLGLNQTNFGALLGLNQPEVSAWEAPDKKDKPLPPDLAKRFLDVCDCFPTPPVGNFDDILARWISYLARDVSSQKLVRMVPAEYTPGQPPVIYWAPDVRGTAGQENRGSEPGSDNAKPSRDAREGPRELLRVDFSRLTIALLWTQARSSRGSAALRSLLTVVPLILLLIPTACFRETLRGKTDTVGPFLDRPPSSESDTQQMGEKSTERYVPTGPLPGQAVEPCDPQGREVTINGGCWVQVPGPPPCGPKLYRNGDKCYLPIAADPKVPLGEKPQVTGEKTPLAKTCAAPPRASSTMRRR